MASQARSFHFACSLGLRFRLEISECVLAVSSLPPSRFFFVANTRSSKNMRTRPFRAYFVEETFRAVGSVAYLMTVFSLVSFA